MAAEEVGSVFVRVRAITSQLAKDIENGAAKGAKDADLKSVGEDLGADLGSGINVGIGDQLDADLPDVIGDGVDDAAKKSRKKTDKTGAGIGAALVQSISRGMKKASKDGGFMKPIIGMLDKLQGIFSKFKIPGGFLVAGLAVPLVAKALTLITQYVIALVGQLGTLALAALAAGAVMATAFGSLALAIIPLVIGLTKETERLTKFKKDIAEIGEAWDVMGDAIQKNAFPGLTRAFKIFTKLVPIFTDFGAALGKQIGTIAEFAAKLFTSEGRTETLGRVLMRAKAIFDVLTRVVVIFVDLFLTFMDAAGPITVHFAESIEKAVGHWRDLVEEGRDSGELGRTLGEWYFRLVAISIGFGDILVAIKNTFKIGAQESSPYFETFNKFAEDWRLFTESTAGKDRIREVFAGLRPVVSELNGLISDLFGTLFESATDGDNSTMVAFLKSLREDVVPYIKDTFIPAFDQLKEPLKELGTQFLELIEKLSELGTLEKMIDVLTLALDVITRLLSIPGMSTFLGLLFTFAGIFSIIGTVLGPLIPVFKFIGTVIGVLGAVIGPFIPVFAGFFATIGTFLAGASLGTIIAIVAGIVAVLAALYLAFRNWDTIVEWIGKAWDAVYEFILGLPELLGSAVSAVVGFITEFVPQIPGLIAAAAGAVVEWLGNAASSLAGVLADFGQSIIDWFVDLPGLLLDAGIEAGTAMLQFIVEAAQEAPGFLSRVLQAIVSWASALGPRIVRAMFSAATGLVDWIIKAIPVMLSFLARFVGQMIGYIVGIPLTIAANMILAAAALVEWIIKAVPVVVTKLGEWALAVYEFITTFIAELPVRLFNAGVAIVQWLADAIPMAATKMGEFTGAVFSAIGQFIIDLPGRIVAAATAIWSWVLVAVPNAAMELRKVWDAIYAAVTTFIEELPGNVAQIAVEIWSWVGDAVEEAATQLDLLFDEMVAWFTALPGKLKDAMLDAAKGIAKGFIDGIEDQLEKLPGGGAAKKVLEGAGSALGGLIPGLAGINVPFNAIVTGFEGLKFPDVPAYKTGGFAPAVPGGFIARLGDGGYDEIVMSTDPRMVERNREMAAASGVLGGSTGGLNIENLTLNGAADPQRHALDFLRHIQVQRMLGTLP